MKYSNDAMRDVLMFMQEKSQYEQFNGGSTEKNKFTIWNIAEDDYFIKLFDKHKYTKEELVYTIEKMVEGGLLLYSGQLNVYYQITDISFRGIQLLEQIRPESIWDKTKSIANKVGNHTINFIETVAHDIAVESAKQAVSVIMNQ